MLTISLIFLLLSNSITLRRDKSILYSRVSNIILIISAFIIYDNLYFLFLNKGIGIFGGYIFMSLVGILTSIISAIYYLAIIKQIFFDKPYYDTFTETENIITDGLITEKNFIIKKVSIKLNNIVLSSSLSLSISIITLIILLFIFVPQE